MNNLYTRLWFALTGALLSGFILALIYTPAAEEFQETIIENVQTVETDLDGSTTEVAVVYAVKKIFLTGWQDVVEPYFYLTLEPMLAHRGVELESEMSSVIQGVLCNTYAMDETGINEERTSIPTFETIIQRTILRHHSFYNIIYSSRTAPVVGSVTPYKDVRCRGPALGLALTLSNTRRYQEVNIVELNGG